MFLTIDCISEQSALDHSCEITGSANSFYVGYDRFLAIDFKSLVNGLNDN